jgi:hypothetical protein
MFTWQNPGNTKTAGMFGETERRRPAIIRFQYHCPGQSVVLSRLEAQPFPLRALPGSSLLLNADWQRAKSVIQHES